MDDLFEDHFFDDLCDGCYEDIINKYIIGEMSFEEFSDICINTYIKNIGDGYRNSFERIIKKYIEYIEESTDQSD